VAISTGSSTWRKATPPIATTWSRPKADGYLVGPFTINVPLRIPQRGLRYDELSDEEKEHWDELDWDEDDPTPAEVTADEVNRFLFNEDTIDKMLQTVMTHGYRVEGGERLGKTIVFARHKKHAEFIVQRFDTLYPEHGGEFARVVIIHGTHGVAGLISQFRRKDSPCAWRSQWTCSTPASTSRKC
jgi:type I restriction enzyme, R subunit